MTLRAAVFALSLSVSLGIPASSNAEPFVVYTVTGEPGNWLLDFSVTNTLGTPGLDIYFFGVKLPAYAIVSGPAGWPSRTNIFAIAPRGGSSTEYNNGWLGLVDSSAHIQMDETLSGFVARDSAITAPSIVQWFAFGWSDIGATYGGTDFCWTRNNPGFEGLASAAAPVPEPATLTLLGVGLAGTALRARYRRRRGETRWPAVALGRPF